MAVFFLFVCFFLQTMGEMFIEKAVSIFVIIQWDRKVKKLQLHKFRAQRYGDIWPTKVGKPWREKGGAHFVQTWCQKDLQTLYQKTTVRQTHVMWIPKRPSRSYYIYIGNTTYKDSAPKTLDELRQWLRFACLHSIPHCLENVRKHKGSHSGN